MFIGFGNRGKRHGTYSIKFPEICSRNRFSIRNDGRMGGMSRTRFWRPFAGRRYSPPRTALTWPYWWYMCSAPIKPRRKNWDRKPGHPRLSVEKVVGVLFILEPIPPMKNPDPLLIWIAKKPPSLQALIVLALIPSLILAWAIAFIILLGGFIIFGMIGGPVEL